MARSELCLISSRIFSVEGLLLLVPLMFSATLPLHDMATMSKSAANMFVNFDILMFCDAFMVICRLKSLFLQQKLRCLCFVSIGGGNARVTAFALEI